MATGRYKFVNPSEYPMLSVPQHSITRAVHHLEKVEALALIRGAYQDDDVNLASLKDAEIIYSLMIQEGGLNE